MRRPPILQTISSRCHRPVGGPRRFFSAPRNQRPELDRPAPDRFVADVNSALRQQFFDVAKAQAETKVAKRHDGSPRLESDVS